MHPVRVIEAKPEIAYPSYVLYTHYHNTEPIL